MIPELKAYPAMKDSGVTWLGEVPEHWEVRRLRNAAELRVSNVDKHTKEGEVRVRLCNYVDVYKRERIRSEQPFMFATATEAEIERFRLESGDVLITKDSESWDDIGVPALVEETADDLISGYHLAILRPYADQISGAYLLRAIQSSPVKYQFHVEAKGVTRYGLSHSAIKSVWLPVPPPLDQAAIVRFLDHADLRIRRYVRAKQRLIGASDRAGQESCLFGEYRARLIADVVTGKRDVRDAVRRLGSEVEKAEADEFAEAGDRPVVEGAGDECEKG